MKLPCAAEKGRERLPPGKATWATTRWRCGARHCPGCAALPHHQHPDSPLRAAGVAGVSVSLPCRLQDPRVCAPPGSVALLGPPRPSRPLPRPTDRTSTSFELSLVSMQGAAGTITSSKHPILGPIFTSPRGTLMPATWPRQGRRHFSWRGALHIYHRSRQGTPLSTCLSNDDSPTSS